MRILIDTNLWISALLSRTTRERVALLIAHSDIILLGSENLMAEIMEVVHRPKIARYLSDAIAAQFLQVLLNRLDLVQVVSKVKVCRDPDDDYLLAICQDAQADFLLTGDKDLLDLGIFGQTHNYFPD